MPPIYNNISSDIKESFDINTGYKNSEIVSYNSDKYQLNYFYTLLKFKNILLQSLSLTIKINT